MNVFMMVDDYNIDMWICSYLNFQIFCFVEGFGVGFVFFSYFFYVESMFVENGEVGGIVEQFGEFVGIVEVFGFGGG